MTTSYRKLVGDSGFELILAQGGKILLTNDFEIAGNTVVHSSQRMGIVFAELDEVEALEDGSYEIKELGVKIYGNRFEAPNMDAICEACDLVRFGVME